MPRKMISVVGLVFLLLACITTWGLFPVLADDDMPKIKVSGGMTLNGAFQRLLFTWNSVVTFQGRNWQRGETVTIILHGPMNSLGVGASELILGSVTADADGDFSISLPIPYDSGVVGPSARVPRPGHYQVQGVGSASGKVTARKEIDLCPSSFVPLAGFDWGRERGGRDGVLPGFLHDFSPEKVDPECEGTWDELPVAAYGTIARTDANGDDQPALISFNDNPAAHYGHDANFFLVPDAPFRWLIGTNNYFPKNSGTPHRDLGRLEIEWETQNSGNTATYGLGTIGLPIWVNPTVDDRVFVVGRWILDVRHAEFGSRTEIHPPRLLATIRKRAAITQANGSRAQQVDIYVSGHGGGANQVPVGLSAVLDQGADMAEDAFRMPLAFPTKLFTIGPALCLPTLCQ